MEKVDYLLRLYLSLHYGVFRFYLSFELIYKLIQFLNVAFRLLLSNLFSRSPGMALRHRVVRLKITKLIKQKLWGDSYLAHSDQGQR